MHERRFAVARQRVTNSRRPPPPPLLPSLEGRPDDPACFLPHRLEELVREMFAHGDQLRDRFACFAAIGATTNDLALHRVIDESRTVTRAA